jgi:hypothetical protein
MKLVENIIFQVELDYTDDGKFKSARLLKVFPSRREKVVAKSKRELKGADIGQIEL